MKCQCSKFTPKKQRRHMQMKQESKKQGYGAAGILIIDTWKFLNRIVASYHIDTDITKHFAVFHSFV